MNRKIIRTNGLSNVASLILPTRSEHCLSVCGADDLAMHRILGDAVRERKALPLNRFVFAGRSHYDNYRKSTPVSSEPLAWLQGDACKDGEISSMQCSAISGIEPEALKVRGRQIGFVYEDEHARYCRLCGVAPENLSLLRPAQVRQVFEIMNEGLTQHGFHFTDTVRTWIYLDKLLDWYGEFNAVRTAFFEEHRVFDGMVPASTGIGASNQHGAAMICDLLAVRPKSPKVKIGAVESPMQGSALSYKSSFSRAVEMAFPTHRALYISGTASIDREGKSVHVGDSANQIDLTMQVVEALLKSRGMSWQDIFRGIAYFKDMADRPLFDKYCIDHGIPKFPLAVAHADICRRDLLFELEADAVKLDRQ